MRHEYQQSFSSIWNEDITIWIQCSRPITTPKMQIKYSLYLEWSLLRGVLITGKEAFISELLVVIGRLLLFGGVLLGRSTIVTVNIFSAKNFGGFALVNWSLSTSFDSKKKDKRTHTKVESPYLSVWLTFFFFCLYLRTSTTGQTDKTW